MENEKINLKTLSSNMKELLAGIAQVSKSSLYEVMWSYVFIQWLSISCCFGVFIIVFYMYNGYELAGTWPAWFNTLNAMITAFIVIPIISRMAKDEVKAFIVSTFISIIGYMLKWWGFDKDLVKSLIKQVLVKV